MIKSKNEKFHQHWRPVSINNIDINKIAVSNKPYFGEKIFKYFIGYKNDEKGRPTCIFLPKIHVYRRNFDETKYISFLIKDDEFLKNMMKFGKKS